MSLWQIIFSEAKLTMRGTRVIISSLAIGIGLNGQRARPETHRRFRNDSAESYFGVGMPSRSDIRTSSARELAAIFSIT